MLLAENASQKHVVVELEASLKTAVGEAQSLGTLLTIKEDELKQMMTDKMTLQESMSASEASWSLLEQKKDHEISLLTDELLALKTEQESENKDDSSSVVSASSYDSGFGSSDDSGF
jgi:hypothetical protein